VTAAGPSGRRLEGEVALVTGASGGIGRATAIRLAQEGASVIASDVADALTGQPQAKIPARGTQVVLDVTDPEAWDERLGEIERDVGALSILVNAAGILRMGGIELSLDTWRATIAVNLDGVFFGCRAAVRAMRPRRRGAIVNVASISGIRADSRTVAYDASKAGVRALTKEVAVYCARHGLGIRCNSVHPGSVDTPMMRTLAEHDPDAYKDWVEAAPSRRLADPAEIASMVAHLCSPDAGWVTGAEYVIDGGASV
jgi:NAD(P)-dependent dehydrogenase (short-subunit alcohol dehydrogenase family)